MKHGHGTRGTALASNAARRVRGTAAPTWADSHWIGPTQAVSAETADSGQNSKKKKKVQNTPFELNIKPYFSSLHTNTPNFSSLPLSHSVTRLSLSMCSLPLSLLAMRHSASAELVTWLTSYFSYYLLLLLNLVYVCIMWKSMLSNILKI